MITDIGLLTIAGMPVLGIVIAIVQFLKLKFDLSSRWAGVAAVVSGMILSEIACYAAGATTPRELLSATIIGLVVGLSASGTYSTGKAVIGK